MTKKRICLITVIAAAVGAIVAIFVHKGHYSNDCCGMMPDDDDDFVDDFDDPDITKEET